jgi:hypothetical protein
MLEKLPEDARRKAQEHGVSNLEGDVRKLKEVVNQRYSNPFYVLVNAWTSIGFYKEEEDLSIFKQTR